MMQNELLPRDWAIHDFIDPTVISVWFEKKKGMDSKVLINGFFHFKTSSKVSPMVAGVGEIAAPAFFRALILSSALPEPPLITAPAWLVSLKASPCKICLRLKLF
jgi:hypothetical protein